MNCQPTHDIETNDFREHEQIVAKPDDIDIGDLPNSDVARGDMRGPEPEPVTDPEADHNKMIIGAVIAAVVIGGVAIYTAGMWSAAPRAPAQTTRVAASDSAPPVVSAVASQRAVVEPTAPVTAALPNEVVSAPVSAHVAKRSVAPSRIPAIHASPNPALAPPATTMETIPLANRPLIAVPQEPTQALPAPPAADPTQSLPDQPVPPVPSPQPKPTEPPQ